MVGYCCPHSSKFLSDMEECSGHVLPYLDDVDRFFEVDFAALLDVDVA